jgi:putative peptidoglycan lipid II flippase
MPVTPSSQVLSRGQLARATVVVAVATLASRALGFARETVFAYFFGATGKTDAYNAASTIPLVLFAGVQAAITTIFIPVFTETLTLGDRRAAERPGS